MERFSFTIKAILLIILLSGFRQGLFAQNHVPVAVNDTVYGLPEQYVYFNPLKNDIDSDGDSLYVIQNVRIHLVNDTTCRLRIDPQLIELGDTETYWLYPYVISDGTDTSDVAWVAVRDSLPLRYNRLDINNINALVSPVGQHFWDYVSAQFEVPKGSGKQAMFNNSVWLAGKDGNGVLHAAAEKYKQQGSDFFAGPVSDVYDQQFAGRWNRTWKISLAEIETHLNGWNQPGYTPSDIITSWPAHGDTLRGQSAFIAPFLDRDNNGRYEPLSGDYPLIRGDQAVFFVYNDMQKPHTDSEGISMGIEIHGMAYAYNAPDDSALNNTVFIHCDIVNRSDTSYNSVYLGLYTDFDLGYEKDDYMGTDVANGMLYVYNGDSIDGSGQSYAYGENPPAAGLKIIGGPYLEPDGIDNLPGGCDYSINGLNFGDRIMDNERYGLTNSMVLIDPSPFYFLDYFNAADAHHLMQNVFRDESHTIFGGNAHDSLGGVGPACNFMFPGTSDTICNWGTNGLQPNGGFNTNGLFWTDSTAGNLPDNRVGMAAMGPFNFLAGETVPLDYSISWARDYSRGNASAVQLLKNRIQQLEPRWNDLIAIPVSYNGVNEQPAGSSLLLYPNPAGNEVTVVLQNQTEARYYLFTVNGVQLLQGTFTKGSNTLNISELKPGVYILKCGSHASRLLKM